MKNNGEWFLRFSESVSSPGREISVGDLDSYFSLPVVVQFNSYKYLCLVNHQ